MTIQTLMLHIIVVINACKKLHCYSMDNERPFRCLFSVHAFKASLRQLGMCLFTNPAVFFNIAQNVFDPPIPDICHFFTRAKFLGNKIYTEIYTVNCQFTQ